MDSFHILTRIPIFISSHAFWEFQFEEPFPFSPPCPQNFQKVVCGLYSFLELPSVSKKVKRFFFHLNLELLICVHRFWKSSKNRESQSENDNAKFAFYYILTLIYCKNAL